MIRRNVKHYPFHRGISLDIHDDPIYKLYEGFKMPSSKKREQIKARSPPPKKKQRTIGQTLKDVERGIPPPPEEAAMIISDLEEDRQKNATHEKKVSKPSKEEMANDVKKLEELVTQTPKKIIPEPSQLASTVAIIEPEATRPQMFQEKTYGENSKLTEVSTEQHYVKTDLSSEPKNQDANPEQFQEKTYGMNKEEAKPSSDQHYVPSTPPSNNRNTRDLDAMYREASYGRPTTSPAVEKISQTYTAMNKNGGKTEVQLDFIANPTRGYIDNIRQLKTMQKTFEKYNGISAADQIKLLMSIFREEDGFDKSFVEEHRTGLYDTYLYHAAETNPLIKTALLLNEILDVDAQLQRAFDWVPKSEYRNERLREIADARQRNIDFVQKLFKDPFTTRVNYQDLVNIAKSFKQFFRLNSKDVNIGDLIDYKTTNHNYHI